MSNRKLSQEDVEESLYKASALQDDDDDSATLNGFYSDSDSEDDGDDSARKLKRSPAFEDDDDEGWNQTVTFYAPHPALANAKNSLLDCDERDDSAKET